MKKILPQVPSCRNPQEFNNPINLIKAILEKPKEKKKDKLIDIKEKVIY